MENRKLPFAVMRLQFHIAGIPILARRSLFSATMLIVFHQVEVHHVYRPKTGIIHRFE